MMDNPVWDWAYELAAHLGYYNVDAMLASAPAGQLLKWRVHYEKKPFGSNWHMHSMVAAQIINYLRAEIGAFRNQELKERDFLKSDAFVPKFGKKRPGAWGRRARVTGAKALAAAFKAMAGLRR